MSEYAMSEASGYGIGMTGSASFTTDARPSARIEQVKALDEALSRMVLHVEKLSARLGPALRPSVPEAVGLDKAEAPSESDIVAHLRHTARRVNDLSDTLAGLTERIDI